MGSHEPTRGADGGPTRARAASSRAGQVSGAALSPEIPDKLYFRIGDVARICDVPAYVLRFWETEFPQLRPNKGGTGQRLYRRREVELVLRIRQLLYDEGYTISGARQLLKSEQRQAAPQLSLLGPEPLDLGKLKGLRRELESIVALLSRPPGVRSAAVPMRSPRRGAARQTVSAVESLFRPGDRPTEPNGIPGQGPGPFIR